MSKQQVDAYVPKYINEDAKKEEINYIRCCGCSKQLRMDRRAYAPNIDYYCTVQCKLDNGWMGAD